MNLFIKNNTTLIVKASLLLGFVSAMFGSLIAQSYLWYSAYYHLMEIGFIFYLLAFYILSKHDSKAFSKLWQTITLIILLCSVSTLWDEFFHDATKVEFNDLIRITTIILISILIKYNKTPWKTQFLKR